MNNTKNKKSKHILTAVLASLIIVSTLSASVMSGCGEDSSTTTETIAVPGTSVVTNVIEETYYTDENGNVVSKNNESSNSENSENSKSDSGNSADNNSSDSSDSSNSSSKSNNSSSGSSSLSNKSNSDSSGSSSSSNKNSNNSSNSSGKSSNSSSNSSGKNSSSSSKSSSQSNSSSSSSKNNSNNSSSKTLSIDGNKYSIGNTVTCVYQLTTPENLENYQAIIKYDSKYLKVKNAEMSGPAASGSVLNYNLTNQIKFNGINISSGYNYKKTKDFVTVTYEVVAGGSTKPTFNWEVATGVSQKSYVSDGKATNGMKLTTSYS